MKGLLLKDFYNLKKNGVFLLITLICFGFVGAMSGMSADFVILWGMVASMQIITTFAFDEAVKWSSFGMTMPVMRKELVRSKFIVHWCLTIFGVGITLAATLLTGMCIRKLTAAMLQELLVTSWLGFWMILFLGSLSMLLLFQFSAERARLIAAFSFAMPIFICGVLINIFEVSMEGVSATIYVILLVGIPLIVLVWEFIMYRISCRIFARKDLA